MLSAYFLKMGSWFYYSFSCLNVDDFITYKFIFIVMAQTKEILKKIKKIILKVADGYGVEIDRIILFGSRARGDFEEHSDWDLLVVVKGHMNVKRKRELWYEIYRRINLPLDLLIVSYDDFERYRESVGFIYRYAIAEGRII